MLENQLKEFNDIKVTFERIKGDKRKLKATVLWKQDFNTRGSENISVFVEIGNDVKQSFEMQKIEDTGVWYTTIIIRSVLGEMYNFEKNLAVKVVEYKVIPYQQQYSYVF